MVDETNLYATQVQMNTDTLPNSRIHEWVPTDKKEMKRFIALLGWMGLCKLPRISDYWSRNEMFSFDFPRSMMSGKRFEALLKFWHFSDNEAYDPVIHNNRLYKIDGVDKDFIDNFQEAYTPSEKICIDETMVPFRGRLGIRQYLPGKSHKYGIKLYKLCTERGYTWNVQIYCGKDSENLVLGSESAIESIVLNLSKDLLTQ